MPRTIVLISCVKEKLPVRARARELYISDFFKKMLAYAESLGPDTIYILSAKHGLLELDTEIDPYDQTLRDMPPDAARAWAQDVLRALAARADLAADRFVILAGEKYREHLLPRIATYELPLQGMKIGEQLRFLKEQAGHPNPVAPPPAISSHPRAGLNPAQKRKDEPGSDVPGIGKYAPLGKFLSALPVDQVNVTLSFGQLEQILATDLPESARKYSTWWNNQADGQHVQARAWMDAGWRVHSLDLTLRQVNFARA